VAVAVVMAVHRESPVLARATGRGSGGRRPSYGGQGCVARDAWPGMRGQAGAPVRCTRRRGLQKWSDIGSSSSRIRVPPV